MVEKIQEWRSHARSVRTEAAQQTDPVNKAALLSIADSWDFLAAERERGLAQQLIPRKKIGA